MKRFLIASAAACLVGIPLLCVPKSVGAAETVSTKSSIGTSKSPVFKRDVDLALGQSEVYKFTNRLKRIHVVDPKVIEAKAVTPHEMMLNAKGPGGTSVTVWDERDLIFTYEISVGGSSMSLRQARDRLEKVLPDEKLSVQQVGKGLAVSGIVSSQEAKKVALGVAESYAPKRVVDNIRVDDIPPQVLLKVHFAEISKSGAIEVGLGFIRHIRQGQNHIGYFPGAPGFSPEGSFLPPITGLPGPDLTFTGAINFFFGTSNRSAGFFLRLLQNKGYLRTIAEPHLRVVSGKKAQFLVGGEVPVPVPGQDGQVTIIYRPFGIQLEFTPKVKKTGYVDLEVKPSVSSVDQSLAVAIQGFNIPGFKRSNTETRVELKSDQTMAISGLLSEETSKNIGQIPFLGDLPILGPLFQSKNFQEDKTELVVLITPQIIRPQVEGELKLSQRGFMVGRVPKSRGGRSQ